MSIAVEKLEAPTVDMPNAPPHYGTPQVDPTEKYIWELEARKTLKKRNEIRQQNQQLYALVTGKCTEAMLAKIEAANNYATINEQRDGIELLIVIRGICYTFQDQRYVPQSIHEAKQRLYAMKQYKHMSQ